ADDDGELRDFSGGDGGDHLRAVLGDALVLVALADHEAGDVLQEHEWDLAAAAHLDEVGALDGALGEQDAVVGEDADGIAHDPRESTDERRAVSGLELVEAAAIDDAGDDLADIVGAAEVRRDDAVDVTGVVGGWLGRGQLPRQVDFRAAEA